MYIYILLKKSSIGIYSTAYTIVFLLAEISQNYGFSKQKIDYILKNKNYIGMFEYNGKREENNISFEIKQIVSKYIWKKVNT